MNNITASSAFYDHSVLVEQIIWLAGSAAHPTSELHDFLFENGGELLGFDEDEAELEGDELAAAICDKRKFGFLVQLQTPIPKNITQDAKSWQESFGHTRYEWFYAESLDEVPALAKEWRESVFEEQKMKEARPLNTARQAEGEGE